MADHFLAFIEPAYCEHNEDYCCFTCSTASHNALHSELVDGCLACKLKTVRIYGRFTGPASMSDATQEFWHTGDPAVFDRQDKEASLARMQEPLRVA